MLKEFKRDELILENENQNWQAGKDAAELKTAEHNLRELDLEARAKEIEMTQLAKL